MTRNRTETKARILEAVGGIIARSGFRELGINAIAREAGVDKVLIYRYFGGLPELLREFAASSQFWPSFEELMGVSREVAATLSADELGRRYVSGLVRELQRRPMTLEILRWELIEQNELTDEIARVREEWGLSILHLFEQKQDLDPDFPALSALMTAGIVYLILRSKTATVYNGIPIQSISGWGKILNACSSLIEQTLSDK
jgi:AcrR family transcriptional regulator